MRVAIIGCGLIGSRRADIIQKIGTDSVISVVDTDTERAKALAAKIGCKAEKDWQSAIDSDADAVIVSTTNNWLAQISVAALKKGKHVLSEKPMGRNLADAQAMYQAQQSSGRTLKIGFNHRYHPAIFKAHEICAEGKLGKLFYARSFYGHGGRPGYESEWRGNAELSGGGELLDQGVHVIDLLGWFLGDFSKAFGVIQTFQWFQKHGAPVEDNAMATLTSANGQLAMFHTSWTQWKNRFSFEVFGEKGYVRVEGLGGSYGIERLTLGLRKPEGGAPVENEWEFSGPDNSWEEEWKDFTSSIQQGRQPLGSAREGLSVMQVIDAVYRSAKLGAQVDVSK